jgi:hypothetical protein
MGRSNLNVYGAAPNSWPLRTSSVAMCRPASRSGTILRRMCDCARVASVVVRTAGTGLLAFLDCVSRGGQRRDGA